jgi:EAL domain-containing protein (putative c-di-GMP-specific phosphodiesterase class I)/CheY-like chemotaxis protein
MVRSMDSGRLLIFDDDPGVGNIIRLIAEKSGLSARLVTHPEDFFRAVGEWRPTHITIDLVMPDMDGVQVLVELAARNCKANVIITSGMGGRVLDAAGRSANDHGLNIVGVLAKPFGTAAMQELLLQPAGPGAAGARASLHEQGRQSGEITVTELSRGIENHELRVAYQPKVECATGHLAGFEALVRWSHPQRGLIMPERFVPLAEKHGLITALTDEVLDQSLDWFSTYLSDNADSGNAAPACTPRSCVSLSINLSATALKDRTMVEDITARCVRRGVPPERLIFELTETSAMEDPVKSLELLTRMRMKGFRLSIDDFGTGYSSMLQLVRMPFSEIKVDKSFVMSGTRSKESLAVVKSIVDLGRSLGLTSTAEGVEDPDMFEYLKRVGCDFAQGYWISRPMNRDAAETWAAGRRN